MNHIIEDGNTTWCGEVIDSSEFCFKTIEQLIINNKHGDRWVCIQCLDEVINALQCLPPSVQLTPPAQDDITKS